LFITITITITQFPSIVRNKLYIKTNLDLPGLAQTLQELDGSTTAEDLPVVEDSVHSIDLEKSFNSGR
jgi:hypothetical protein